MSVLKFEMTNDIRLTDQQYIARRLLEINERGTWVDPSKEPLSSPKLIKQDEGAQLRPFVFSANVDCTEIFQIARLCNATWFAVVVFSDYFSAILGLVREGSSWSLEPFGEFRNDDHELFERGRGNACSVEVCDTIQPLASTDDWAVQLLVQVACDDFPGR